MTDERLDLYVPLEANLERRTVTGRIVTFGEVGHTSLGPASFGPGSIDVPERVSDVKLIKEHDKTMPVGVAASIEQDEAGLTATFRIPETPVGDSALLEAAEGLRDGLSVGVLVTAGVRDDHGTLVVDSSRLREVSQVALPAFPAARVLSVTASQEDEPMTEAAQPTEATPDEHVSDQEVQAAEAEPEVVMTAAAQTVPSSPAKPVRRSDLRGVSELLAAMTQPGAPHQELTAALEDIITTDAAGLVRPAYVNDMVGRVEGARPVVNSILRRQLPASGMQLQRPRWSVPPVVDVQATEKTQVATAAATILLDSIDVITVAGGNDISVQAAERSDPSLIQELLTMFGAVYANKTEELTVAALTTAAGTATDSSTFTSATQLISAMAEELLAAGHNLEWIAFGPGTLDYMFALTESAAPAWWTGNVNPSTGEGSTTGGIRMFPSMYVGADQVLGGSQDAAAFYEPASSPFQLRAVRADVLGLDLSVYGYHAIDVRDATGLSLMDDSPGARSGSRSRKKD